jgi:hypothetical protein
MKIAIGPSMGGFSISKEGIGLLSRHKCPHLERIPISVFFGDKGTKETDSRLTDYYIENDHVVMEEHRTDISSRTCPILISLIEQHPDIMSNRTILPELSLVVVDIPDNVDVYIDCDNDTSSEHVAEKHRTWWGND